jgi:hypothetical protein
MEQRGQDFKWNQAIPALELRLPRARTFIRLLPLLGGGIVAAKYDKEQLVQILRNLAKERGRKTLSKVEIAAIVPPSSIGYHFGSVGAALEAAGLERTLPWDNLRGRGNRYSDDDLFSTLWEVETRVGHEPTAMEVAALSPLSPRPFRRFGKWKDTIACYKRWKSSRPDLKHSAGQGGESVPSGGIESLQEDENPTDSESDVAPIALERSQRKPHGQLYGEPIEFRGLRHAPINEQGVVFLFGMVSRELGFNIESVQQGFPDCEGKYLYDSKKNLWAKARIEFEYRSSSFLQHGHDSAQCDFIVCWINDWPDCPIDVLELRSELRKLRPS